MKTEVYEFVTISEYDEIGKMVNIEKVINRTKCKTKKEAHQCLRDKRYGKWWKDNDFYHKNSKLKLSDGHELLFKYESTIIIC